jgi:hypothetical protein
VERNLLTSASFLDFIKVLEILGGDSSDLDGFDTLMEWDERGLKAEMKLMTSKHQLRDCLALKL